MSVIKHMSGFRPTAADRTRLINPFRGMDVLERARQLEASGVDIVHLEVGYFLFFTVLFYLGIGSSLSIAHVGIEFLLSFNENEIILRSQNYFQFITRVSLLFGISFQFPLVILFLLNKKIIDVESLTKKRPEMFIVILIFSAIITPTGDPVSLFVFTIPMYLLIEVMIFVHKKSKRGI